VLAGKKEHRGIPHKGYAMHVLQDDLHPRDEGHNDFREGGLEEALAAGAPARVGWFRYYFDDDRWEWSPQVEKMHGYLPGAVTPTTEMVLAHKHPDDYRQIAHTLDLIRQTRQPFSSRHRICDIQGRVHHVVVVGDLLPDDSGFVIGTHGFYIDVTPAEQARQDQVTAAVTRITKNRTTIEQTKGMLMLVYGIDEPAAFELLKRRSQETNVKLKRLAEQVSADFLALSGGEALPPRSAYDNLLLSAHLRINGQHQPTLSTVLPPSEDTG
jgi:PAS domain S-box-containing protein